MVLKLQRRRTSESPEGFLRTDCPSPEFQEVWGGLREPVFLKSGQVIPLNLRITLGEPLIWNSWIFAPSPTQDIDWINYPSVFCWLFLHWLCCLCLWTNCTPPCPPVPGYQYHQRTHCRWERKGHFNKQPPQNNNSNKQPFFLIQKHSWCAYLW